MRRISKKRLQQLTTDELGTAIFGAASVLQAQANYEDPELQGGLIDNLQWSKGVGSVTPNLLEFLKDFDELSPLGAIDFTRQLLDELESRVQADAQRRQRLAALLKR